MKKNHALLLVLSFALLLLTSISAVAQAPITSCTVIFITPDCDGCDDKDDDTKIRVSVFGANGYEFATAYYTVNKKFDDNGSENAVPCAITNTAGSQAAFAQKIVVVVEPNGNDDWVFEARVIITRADGFSSTTNMRGRAAVSSGSPKAVLWANL